MKKNKAEVFQPSGETKRVHSLGGGTYLRVGDHRGKWHHLSVQRDADDLMILLQDVAADNPEFAARIVGELLALNADEFGWLAEAITGTGTE